MDTAKNSEYQQSVARVLSYIDKNLSSDLSLQQLADVAMFSRHHFHRIFKGATGMPLGNYVTRRRLERAATLLKRDPNLTVTQVALQVGYRSPEHFSRQFRERFAMSADAFRKSNPLQLGSAIKSKIDQADAKSGFYSIYEESRAMPRGQFRVRLEERPDLEVASISESFGTDGSPLVAAWHELMEWCCANQLSPTELERFCVSHDDVEITADEQYRLDFCVGISGAEVPTGRIVKNRLVGGLYALADVQGDIHAVAQGWDYLYREWLPSSGYRPRDEPAIEWFIKGPEEIGWETFDVRLGFPVYK